MPVAILGGVIDISLINPSTLQLGDDSDPNTPGVRPARISTDDVNGDGINDLIIHFSTQELYSAGLLSKGRLLFITGQLTNGKPFVDSDVVYLSSGPVFAGSDARNAAASWWTHYS